MLDRFRKVVVSELIVKKGITLDSSAVKVGFPAATLPAATLTVIGGVKEAAHQAPSTASTVAGLVTDHNNLIAALVAAGMISAT